jgi:hypothetical protein
MLSNQEWIRTAEVGRKGCLQRSLVAAAAYGAGLPLRLMLDIAGCAGGASSKLKDRASILAVFATRS